MKLKIQTLNKKEYKNVYTNYKNTTKGKEQIARLTRLLIVGILSLLVSSYLIYDNIIESSAWYGYITPILLIVFGIMFILGSIKLKRESLNNYFIKNNNSKY